MQAQCEQIHYSTIAFRSLLDSLARPGKITMLEHPHWLDTPPLYSPSSEPVNIYALAAIMTLLDKEVTFIIAAHNAWLAAQDALVQWVTLRSGSKIAHAREATFALFCDGKSNGLLPQLNVGTLAEPEASTTAFYCVEQIGNTARTYTNEVHTGEELSLSGPGIKDTTTVYIDGLERETLYSILSVRQGYPLGVDIFLIDAVGRCVGLPRTTHISIKE